MSNAPHQNFAVEINADTFAFFVSIDLRKQH